MKKPLHFRKLKNSKGIILPYFMFVTVFVLMIITASLNLYQNHLEITYLETEQIKLETLLQIAQVKFDKEYLHQPDLIDMEPIIYHFPYGNVVVTHKVENDTQVITFRATTSKNSQHGIIVHKKINPEI